MNRHSAIALGVLIIAACSGTGPNAPESVGNADTVADESGSMKGDDIVCRREATIGSNMRKRTCRTRAADEAAREAAQDSLTRNAERTDETRTVTE